MYSEYLLLLLQPSLDIMETIANSSAAITYNCNNINNFFLFYNSHIVSMMDKVNK